MPTNLNPFAGQLTQVPSLRKGARQSLDEIYKAMRANNAALGTRLGGLNKNIATQIGGVEKTYKGNLASILGGVQKDTLQIAEQSSGNVDEAEKTLLSKISGEGVVPYQGYAGTTSKAGGEFQRSLRGIDKQYVKDLQAGAIREKAARSAELESSLLGYQTGLATNSAMMNASLMSMGGVATGRGGGLIAAAQQYLGRPYVWGGESLEEGRFDCSGLIWAAARQQGINLPRTAREQQAATQYVGNISQAQPGDLLYWGNPATHTAIYIGNGMMIASPRRGETVQVQSVYGNPQVHRI